MPAQRIQKFTGVMPRLGRRVLPDGAGQVAYNCLMASGNLMPINGPLEVEVFGGTDVVRSVYRMFSGSTDYWLRWASDVDVAKGPISGDESFRVYFTSDEFEPRVTNRALAVSAAPYPTAWYVLGVTPPVTAASIIVTGGSGAAESRAYVYTFATTWGEESAPSPASAVLSGFINGSWDLSGMDTAPPNTYAVTNLAWAGGVLTLTVDSAFGLRAGEHVTLSGLGPAALNTSWPVATVPGTASFTILMADPGTLTDVTGTATRDAPHNTSGMVKRIYRAVTTSTTTEYFYVDEIAVASTTYSDTATTIGEPCPTVGWAMPPAGLRGLKTLPSGAMVGFVGNILCFSEPLAVYAWPVSYQQVTDYDIVGLDIFGQSVVVGTSGHPYIATGVDPASMSLQKLDRMWPCLAKRSMVSLGSGVAYACPQGLAVVGSAGAELVTSEYYTFTEWEQLYPSTFIAAQFDTRYYASFTLDATTGGMWVFGQNAAVLTTRRPTALYTDPGTGVLYVVIDNVLYEWMGDVGTRESLDWQSKEYVVPNPVNLGAAKIDADFTMTAAQQAAAQANYNAILAANEALIAAGTSGGSLNGLSFNQVAVNGSLLAILPPLTFDTLAFTLYRGTTAVFSTQVTDSNVFRIPAGVKYDAYAVRVSGNVVIQAILVGPTPLSLKSV
jgi:hypothetical protein